MNLKCVRIAASLLTALCLTVSAPGGAWANSAAEEYETTTPIKHLVVIFQENVSFDHYFATYPYAYNKTSGEPTFTPRPNTPAVNNLLSGGLLMNNPNSTQPFRLARNQAVTCDQSHAYTSEQQAADHGLMDNFPTANGTDNATFGIIPASLPTPVLFGVNQPTFAFTHGESFIAGNPLQPGQYYEEASTAFQGYCFDDSKGLGIVMGYYDGNTVTALWNYAQQYAMSDNSWDTSFGPSAPGAINVVSGNTSSFMMEPSPNGKVHSASGYIWGGSSTTPGSLIGDARPYLDDCDLSNSQLQGSAVAKEEDPTNVPANIGDLLGDKDFHPATEITWGWFAGGFAPKPAATSTTPAVCSSAGTGIAGFGAGPLPTSSGGASPLPDNITTVGDYIPHHEPFQYYASSQNLHHLPPTSTIGTTDQANHQYDLSLFFTALKNGELPAVSYLKAPAYEDGHPGYSDPLDEQYFIVNTINMIMASDEWKSTAIVILYDDSDGWYDHQPSPIVNQSGATGNTDDYYFAAGFCGSTNSPTLPTSANELIQGRCGYGTRQPLLVISPWARENYVDHRVTDQSSIVRFIEDNWSLPRLANSSDFKAGKLDNMFDFNQESWSNLYPGFPDSNNRALLLNPGTGEIETLGGSSGGSSGSYSGGY